MKIRKADDRRFIMDPRNCHEIDLLTKPRLYGNFQIPLTTGEWLRLYPYCDYYVKIGNDKIYHVDSKDAWDILVNKIMLKISLARL